MLTLNNPFNISVLLELLFIQVLTNNVPISPSSNTHHQKTPSRRCRCGNTHFNYTILFENIPLGVLRGCKKTFPRQKKGSIDAQASRKAKRLDPSGPGAAV
jgi:hypothetical protein